MTLKDTVQTSIARSSGRVDSSVAVPGPLQTRTCAIDASGSSVSRVSHISGTVIYAGTIGCSPILSASLTIVIRRLGALVEAGLDQARNNAPVDITFPIALNIIDTFSVNCESAEHVRCAGRYLLISDQ